MLPRYSREEMEALWGEDNKIGLWFEVEVAAVEAWSEIGMCPPETAAAIRLGASVDLKRMAEIEAVTKHDVAAFVQSLEEQVGPEHGRWIHFGMTSSDVLDTAFAMQLRDAGAILLEDIDNLMSAIKRRAFEHKDTVMVGRSHGIHAEPTTFGHVLAIWYDEMRRHRRRFKAACVDIAVGKVSGAVGTFSNISPEVEARTCEKLGLKAAPASSQIIQRDRHAAFFSAMALIASSLEKFSVQVRHMQRTEVLEAEEKFSKGQKGSSAMPHKRNPVLSENVSGLVRLIRGYALPAMENVALWHERDISHSSVERVMAPDATTLLDFAMARMTKVIDELVVYPDAMAKNLAITKGLVFSQSVLCSLIQVGLGRDEAYGMVQTVAMQTWADDRGFEENVRDSDIANRLSAEVLNNCFDLKRTLKHIDVIFDRVFNQSENS